MLEVVEGDSIVIVGIVCYCDIILVWDVVNVCLVVLVVCN